MRANGIFVVKADKYGTMMEKLAGASDTYTVEDVRDRIMASLSGLVLKYTATSGDFMYLQTHLTEISESIEKDLNADLALIGLNIADFKVSQVSYPDSVSKMIEKVAGQGMIGDMARYQQTAMADAMSGAVNNGNASSAGTFASMAAGMAMGSN